MSKTWNKNHNLSLKSTNKLNSGTTSKLHSEQKPHATKTAQSKSTKWAKPPFSLQTMIEKGESKLNIE